MKNPKQIAIVGAGAAGLMTAATLLEESGSNKDFEIHLFEKNDVIGIKVALSGGGRCNVTTGITDQKTLLSKYIRGDKFLRPALSAFPPQKVFEWFESHGVPLKIEKDLRVFPVSNVGQHIVDVFEKIFNDERIHIHYNEGVTRTESASNGFKLTTSKSTYKFDVLVLATGGNAYRKTGSTGDGYEFARELGHTITPLGPSLNSFMAAETWCKDLSGISFQDAKLEVVLKNGEKKIVKGPIIFTHFGISGPAIFAMAAHVAFEKITHQNPLILQVTPHSTDHYDIWNARLQKASTKTGFKPMMNVLGEFLPNRFVLKILELTIVSPYKKVAELTKEQRKEIAHLLSSNLKLNLVMRRPGDEFVTAGGVSLDEIESKTMRSRINTNLYFAGEIMNVDGLTGGFNLQASWAAGRAAGNSIYSF